MNPTVMLSDNLHLALDLDTCCCCSPHAQRKTNFRGKIWALSPHHTPIFREAYFQEFKKFPIPLQTSSDSPLMDFEIILKIKFSNNIISLEQSPTYQSLRIDSLHLKEIPGEFETDGPQFRGNQNTKIITMESQTRINVCLI